MFLAYQLHKQVTRPKLFVSAYRSLHTIGRKNPLATSSLMKVHQRNAWTQMKAFFGKERTSAEQSYAKFGKESSSPYRAEYEKEIQERTRRKLNWGIQNRWEQRELDDIYKNEDIRAAQFRDFTKQLMETRIIGVKEFNSVEEIYYYIENMFKEGIAEPTLMKALDIFIRDADQFTDEDLDNPIFKKLLKEISKNLVTFSKEESYVKTVQFMDIYCISDSRLWVNMEIFVLKKDHILSGEAIIRIMTHFSRQNEGSKDFYHFIEHCFYSEKFDDADINHFVSLGHNFYLVHTGGVKFFEDYADNLLEKLDESVSTFNLLRIAQTFAEIGPKFPEVFNIIEYHLLKRYEQLMTEEMVCSTACFAIAGQGSKLMFSLFEKQVCKTPNLDYKTLRDACKSFIYSMRGSDEIFKTLEHGIRAHLAQFSVSEK